MTTKDQDKERDADGTVKDGASTQPKDKGRQPESSTGKGSRATSTRGEEVDPRTGRAVGEEYDPMQDPTFNKNEAQQFAEPGHAGSDEAADAQEEVS
jgi:hypothetical protein